MPHPLVISYYTPNTRYEAHAQTLRASLRRLGLPHRIEPREAKPSWIENCAQKAIFIRDVWHEVGRPVLWVDADGVMMRPMHEVTDCTADLAVVKSYGWRFYGGQIYFGASDKAGYLLHAWCRYCQNDPHVWDQVSLGYAWWDTELEKGLSVLWLPNTIREVRRGLPAGIFQRIFSRAAITHKRESRQSKNKQAKPRIEEFNSDDLPDWWRQAAIEEKPFPLSHEQRRELGLR